jgi:hypothetical protein
MGRVPAAVVLAFDLVFVRTPSPLQPPLMMPDQGPVQRAQREDRFKGGLAGWLFSRRGERCVAALAAGCDQGPRKEYCPGPLPLI